MNTVKYDYLVLGSGIAGLTFALHAAQGGTVAVVCKASLSETNTSHAQGGIAAVLSAVDSIEQHVQDTLTAGAGLCNEAAVRFMAEQAPESIKWLQQQGVPFDRNPAGCLALGLEGGHRQNRIAHVKDHTGLSVQQVLSRKAVRESAISILEHHLGLELLVENGRCYGVQMLDLQTQQVKTILANAVVLATGGSGQVYQYTTNPAIATGDGLAMAFRAGAAVKDMEFFQFHPTALYQPDADDTFLISEALRGAGAELVLPDGGHFMHQYHVLGSLAPRDVVARAVYHEMQQHNSPCLYLDARSLAAGAVKNLFPFIHAKCCSIGIQAERDLIPVVPAAHYQCGGVQTNLNGQTSISGLYAIGEVACTGVHGANRLASNSLLEGVVFAKQAAQHALIQEKESICFTVPEQYTLSAHISDEVVAPVLSSIKLRLQQLMWDKAGIVRTRQGLMEAKQRIAAMLQEVISLPYSGKARNCQELKNLLTAADIVVTACLARRESIGGHYIEEKELQVA